MLNRTSSVPLHIQLANLLREQALRKELRPDERLPSERELCQRYGISRITVRQALQTLAQEGLVYTSVGKGTYISDPTMTEELRPLSSFTQDLERRGMHASSQVLEASLLPADEKLATSLKIPKGSEVVRLHRVRLADGQPIALQLTYLPHHLCLNLLRFDFTNQSLYAVLRTEYRLTLARSTTVIEACLANADEARLLKLALPAALLVSLQTTYLDSGMVIEVTRTAFNSERYKFHMHA